MGYRSRAQCDGDALSVQKVSGSVQVSGPPRPGSDAGTAVTVLAVPLLEYVGGQDRPYGNCGQPMSELVLPGAVTTPSGLLRQTHTEPAAQPSTCPLAIMKTSSARWCGQASASAVVVAS